MVGNRRQGWALYAAMMALFVVGVARRLHRRAARLPGAAHAGVDTAAFDGSTGGNMEGKEQRFGIADSVAVGRRHDGRLLRRGQRRASTSLTGIGGAVPMANMMTGEVIFGGVGSGLYGDAAVRPPRRSSSPG